MYIAVFPIGPPMGILRPGFTSSIRCDAAKVVVSVGPYT
jgi:hypothetical protein